MCSTLTAIATQAEDRSRLCFPFPILNRLVKFYKNPSFHCDSHDNKRISHSHPHERSFHSPLNSRFSNSSTLHVCQPTLTTRRHIFDSIIAATKVQYGCKFLRLFIQSCQYTYPQHLARRQARSSECGRTCSFGYRTAAGSQSSLTTTTDWLSLAATAARRISVPWDASAGQLHIDATATRRVSITWDASAPARRLSASTPTATNKSTAAAASSAAPWTSTDQCVQANPPAHYPRETTSELFPAY